MKALMKVARGVGNFQLKDIPIPVPGDNEVLIRVHTAGVCGTDVHLYHDRFANSPPFVLGHEFSGTIEKIGTGIRNFKVGDRVVSANNPYACGVCRLCSAGYPNLCQHKRAMGIHSDGCFAEFVKLPANLLHHIPDNVSFEEAALVEPLAVAIHSVHHRCGIKRGDKVVVFGPGTIGLLAAQVAHAEGAEEVILVGINADEHVRLKCAQKLGIKTLNSEKVDLQEKIMAITRAEGADVVVEASGSSKAIFNAIDILGKRGRMAVSGLTGQPDIRFCWDKMVAKAITIFFSYGSINSDWQRALQYLSQKKVQTLQLITHRFVLEQWQDALKALTALEAIKPVFIMA